MKRKLFLTGIVLSIFCNAWAGGLLTNTNQSVHFLRNPARDASIEIDAAYTNPAGLAFLPGEGFFFSVNNQSAFQTRTITTDFAPFAGLGGSAEKAFEGKASALIIPNLQAAYKTDSWTFSANLGVVGGGGTLKFSQGLPSFESTLAIVPVVLNKYVPSIGGYDLESSLKGSSVIYGAQLGATYAVAENFSAYAGLRYNYVSNSYEAYLRNTQMGMGDKMYPAEYIIGLNPAFTPFAPLVAEKNLDCKQTGSGITPVIGLDYHWNGLNIGAKYEFKTGMELKNKTATNTTGLDDYNDGAPTAYDLPALLTFGVQYDLIPALTVSAGYHHFFDSNAKMAHNKQEYVNGGINEYLAGIEYRINDMFLVSCGTQIVRSGVTDDYQSDMSFSLNSYSLGFGGAINLSKNVRINLAYFFTNYEDWKKESTDYMKINGIPAIPGTDVFGRTNQTFGIGVDFRF
jgi:long-chain fatty acid transport protein